MAILASAIIAICAHAQDVGQDGVNPSCGLNEKFKIGDETLQVLECFKFGGFSPDFGKSIKAGKGVTFLMVKFAVTNDGNETQTVSLDGVKLRDSKGRRFSPSNRLNTALAMDGRWIKPEDLWACQLQPGIRHVTARAFEVPSESLNGIPRLIFFENSDDSASQVEVRLEKIETFEEAMKRRKTAK